MMKHKKHREPDTVKPQEQGMERSEAPDAGKKPVGAFMAFIYDNMLLCLLLALLFILFIAPTMKTGVIFNDELQTRLYARGGFEEFIQRMADGSLYAGRPLKQISYNIFIYLNFLIDSLVYYEAFNAACVLLSVVLFCVLLYKLLKISGLSVLVGVLIMAFMPVSFENVMPNAFNGCTLIPFSLALASMLLFIRYLEKKSVWAMIISLPLLFTAMLSYEMMITLTPMYVVIYMRLSGDPDKNFFRALRKCLPYIVASALYLAVYIAASALYPPRYQNVVFSVSPLDSLKIIGTLSLSALPGAYLLHPHTMSIYKAISGAPPIDNGFELFFHMLADTMNMRMLLLLIIMPIATVCVFKLAPARGGIKPEEANRRKSMLYALGLGLLGMIVPSLPLAFSSGLQATIDSIIRDYTFSAAPTSYVLYFAAMFVAGLLIWTLIECFHTSRIAIGAVIVCVIIGMIPVQAMNEAFAEQQAIDYSNLVAREELLETRSFKKFIDNHKTVLAPDLFRQADALYINDSYWYDYAQIHGLKASIIRKSEQDEEAKLYNQDGAYFVMLYEDAVAVLSETLLSGYRPVKIDEGVYLPALFDYAYAVPDEGMYAYYFAKNSSNELLPVVEAAYYALIIPSGSTLASAKALSGFAGDGWLEPVSEFRLLVGERGFITLKGWYPYEITPGMTGRVYVNGDEHPFTLGESAFELTLPAPPGQVATIRIENDFSFQAPPPDIRILSFIITGLDGE